MRLLHSSRPVPFLFLVRYDKESTKGLHKTSKPGSYRLLPTWQDLWSVRGFDESMKDNWQNFTWWGKAALPRETERDGELKILENWKIWKIHAQPRFFVSTVYAFCDARVGKTVRASTINFCFFKKTQKTATLPVQDSHPATRKAEAGSWKYTKI